MIKVENIDVWGFEHAIRGMRNPLNSWSKSDSFCTVANNFIVGENDLDLMKRLYKGGSEHRKYLRQIMVSMDITAPLYWWSEMDTYKVGTVANSCSKMHKLLYKPFEMSDFSFDKLPGYKNEIKQFVPSLTEEEISNEVWENFDDEYAISSLGRVKHKFKTHYRLLGGSLHDDGYRFVTLHGKQYPVHRLVAKYFHKDTYSEGLVVNHLDGNKQNNHADNLEWVTQKENIKHSKENNLQPIPVNTYQGKFKPEQRQAIKDYYESGKLTKYELAEKYNVSWTCIDDIIRDRYKYAANVNIYEEVAKPLVDTLNELRDSYFNEQDDTVKKQIWYSILQLLPCSYNQKRTVTMNYENVVTMIKQRKGHKLDEWRTFIDILKELPYIEKIMED